MSDITQEVLAGKKRRGPQPRRRIPLPNGDYLQPREELADELGVHPRSVKRMGLPTTYMGNLAYHPHNESMNIIAGRIKRPPQRRGAR